MASVGRCVHDKLPDLKGELGAYLATSVKRSVPGDAGQCEERNSPTWTMSGVAPALL
jgi:hypothetical protein